MQPMMDFHGFDLFEYHIETKFLYLFCLFTMSFNTSFGGHVFE